jgi:signal transduction histidine kinase
LIPLYELSKAFMGMTNLQQLLVEIVEVSCRETGADRASLMLFDEGTQSLTIQAAIGLPEEVVATTRIKLGEGIAGRVAEQREALVLDSTSPPGGELRKLMKQDQISSAVCVPLTVRQELIGVLNLSKLGSNDSLFTAGSLELASVLASQAAIAIKNARLFEETQQAYEDLKKLDELKSEFINVASHELRTPLAILLGYAHLLDEQAADANKKYTEAIIQSATRLKNLVTDMLNLRYLEAGEMELELQPVQVAGTVQAVAQDLGFQVDEKEQSLILSIPEDIPSIWADEGKLHLILSNLLSNAIKFTPRGGSIEIGATVTEDQLGMSVKDTGVGIATEEFRRLFDRFYQVGDSLRREHPGVGLGLSIVKELVELHEGQVWVESEVGKGSTFSFTISRHLRPQPENAKGH